MKTRKRSGGANSISHRSRTPKIVDRQLIVARIRRKMLVTNNDAELKTARGKKRGKKKTVRQDSSSFALLLLLPTGLLLLLSSFLLLPRLLISSFLFPSAVLTDHRKKFRRVRKFLLPLHSCIHFRL